MTHKENQLELVVGGDGYHRILRIIEFSWDTDRDPPKPGKIIEEITAMIKYEAAQFERDWRFAPYKFLKLNAKGEWSGEIVSWPVALGINEWDSDESALIGWKYALNILEDTEDIFSDSWLRAMLFQTWPGDIKGTDDQIVRACLGVGYLLRDWEFKQRHGPKVTSRIKSEAYPSEPGLTTCWVCGCRRQDVRLMFCHAQPLEIRPPDVPRRLRGALSR